MSGHVQCATPPAGRQNPRRSGRRLLYVRRVERPRFVVTTQLPGAAMKLLGTAGEVHLVHHDGTLDPAVLRSEAAGANGLVALLSDRIDAGLLDAAGPGLRVVANVAVGYDNVDLEAARSRGVVVTNTPGVLTDATADLAMALILAVTRRVCEGDRLVRAGGEGSWDIFFMRGASPQGKTLGVVVLGQIGSATARRAR